MRRVHGPVLERARSLGQGLLAVPEEGLEPPTRGIMASEGCLRLARYLTTLRVGVQRLRRHVEAVLGPDAYSDRPAAARPSARSQ